MTLPSKSRLRWHRLGCLVLALTLTTLPAGRSRAAGDAPIVSVPRFPTTGYGQVT